MLKELKPILEIQELDIKMIRLIRLKREREKELKDLNKMKENLESQEKLKEHEILQLKLQIKEFEEEIQSVVDKIKKLESQQHAIKKVEEFNALTHEISSAEKERHGKEQRLSDMYDRLADEEDVLKNLQETHAQTIENSRALETEIHESIEQINKEGRELKEQRDALVTGADPEIFMIYERLLRNKKDRVVVPIENRCCSGCHIMLTAQDENLVRKGERIVFCEHCSRIHFWPESEEVEGTVVAKKRRRRSRTA
ncbi:MAG: zinc ribbon domain-containing protein [Chlamydiales bacterium]